MCAAEAAARVRCVMILAQADPGFAALDWVVMGLYAVVLVITGVAFNRRAASTSDYFLGSRSMPVWAVAVSVVASSLSGATFIGVPQLSYNGDLTYLATNIGMLLAAGVIALVFIPAFYKHNVTSIYSLLEIRFGPSAKRAAAVAFLIGRVMASGARLYIIAIPTALIIFGDRPDQAVPADQLMLAIGVITLVGIVYTIVGGVASVIWTDVIQCIVFTVAVVATIGFLLQRIPVDATELPGLLAGSTTAAGGSKLALFDLSLDPTRPYTLLACCTAFVLMGVASYGTDHDMVQRMLTCRSAVRGAWSVVSAILASVPIVAMFLVVGLLLFVFYRRPDVMAGAAPVAVPTDTRTVFLTFTLREMPAGLTGLIMAGLFAAALGSLNSALNAMSATAVTDLYRDVVRGRSERHYVRAGQIGVAAFGLLLGAFAVVCIGWQRAEGSAGRQLIDFALGVMTFAYSGLLGVYFSALLTRRGSSASATAAIVAGFFVVALQQSWAWDWWLVDLAAARAAIRSDARADNPSWLIATVVWLVDLAFVWKLAIASVAAFVVCQLGRSKPRVATDGRHAPDGPPSVDDPGVIGATPSP